MFSPKERPQMERSARHFQKGKEEERLLKA